MKDKNIQYLNELVDSICDTVLFFLASITIFLLDASIVSASITDLLPKFIISFTNSDITGKLFYLFAAVFVITIISLFLTFALIMLINACIAFINAKRYWKKIFG